MTILLILLLSVALVLLLVCLLVMLHFLRSSRLARNRELQLARVPQQGRFDASAQSVPNCWLAIRSDNPQRVQEALGLLKPKPCSWEEGLSAAREQKLFISPAVDGWVLVMGSSLPEPSQDVDKCFHFLVALSRKLGCVHFFNAHRVLLHHAWVEADHGRIQRAYAWAGQTVWNQGRVSKAELDIGLRCFDYGESAESSYFAPADPAAFNTSRVKMLAARWSVDPASLGARMPRETRGIAGELARSRYS